MITIPTKFLKVAPQYDVNIGLVSTKDFYNTATKTNANIKWLFVENKTIDHNYFIKNKTKKITFFCSDMDNLFIELKTHGYNVFRAIPKKPSVINTRELIEKQKQSNEDFDLWFHQMNLNHKKQQLGSKEFFKWERINLPSDKWLLNYEY